MEVVELCLAENFKKNTNMVFQKIKVKNGELVLLSENFKHYFLVKIDLFFILSDIFINPVQVTTKPCSNA